MTSISGAAPRLIQPTNLSPAQKKQVWTNAIDQLISPLVARLGTPGALSEKRVDAIGTFISDKVQEWLGKNPNATESEIAEKSQALFRTGYGHQLCWKSIDDALFSKMLESLKREIERD